MSDEAFRDRLTRLAQAAGFDLAGIVPVPVAEEANLAVGPDASEPTLAALEWGTHIRVAEEATSSVGPDSSEPTLAALEWGTQIRVAEEANLAVGPSSSEEPTLAVYRDASEPTLAALEWGTQIRERDHSDYLEGWIAAGYAGEMEYLKRRDERERLLRSSVETAFPWARSLVVCAANYNSATPKSVDAAAEGAGWIARYAQSGKLDEKGATTQPTDYHDVLLGRLRMLEGELQAWLGFAQARSYVDTGPIVERAYAQQAGIGWTGKNTCVIHPKLGSWLFLGVIVTSYEVPRGEVLAELTPDRCGSCRRCIEACPTEALIAPYEMDASRCIAYLTIEKRGAIPEPLRWQMGRQVFGCDICQDVCPWNRRAPVTGDAEFGARAELVNPELSWLAELDAQGFNRLFKGTPVKRTKLSGLRRNVAIAMGNSGSGTYAEKLREWARGEDAVLRETAEWALGRIGAKRGV